LVLGDILDKSLRRGLVLTDGSLGPFFTRPISAVLWVTILITVLLSFSAVRRALARLLSRERAVSETGS
jgi:putative tricarboxylic transport membrane protein